MVEFGAIPSSILRRARLLGPTCGFQEEPQEQEREEEVSTPPRKRARRAIQQGRATRTEILSRVRGKI